MASNEMVLIAFMQASNCSNFAASWRHPATAANYLSAEYYQGIARTLEDGKFHLAFFDDRLAMPDIYGDDPKAAVHHGVRAIKLDLISVMTSMAMATRHLGIGGTYSTTYYEPFHVARAFATLDLMSKGRVAWNVVTSLNDSEAANMSVRAHLGHDVRYDRADEFMEVVLGLWESWEDDAIVGDRRNGFFADPAKVHRLNHTGNSFNVRGPLTVPRSPQGHPVIIQAGQSGRGRSFAARWGELIFVIFQNIEMGQTAYRDIKEAVAREGRDPDAVKVAPAIYVIAGETEKIAREKLELCGGLVDEIDPLILISEVSNYDFSKHPIDEPLPDEVVASISGWRSMRDRVIKLSGKSNPSFRDFIQVSGRGSMRELPIFVGDPKQIADELEKWLEAKACDGFVIAATHMPGAYEDFVRLVVPELQRRGLHRTAFRGDTLRENLGLEFPERGAWRTAPA
jgi:FMN-dependent oxidoreductase (nitrilotriacetate monooxygenase family)